MTQAPEYKSPLALAIEAAGRPAHAFEVSAFFGPGNRVVGGIAFRIAVKSEEDRAIVLAHKYAAEAARDAGDAAEAARKDGDLLGDAKTIGALWQVCREAEPDPDKPGAWRIREMRDPSTQQLLRDGDGAPITQPAFPGPEWMRKHLGTDRIAALMRLYMLVRQAEAPAGGLDFDDDRVEDMIAVAAAHFGDDIPAAVLAPYPHEILATAFVFAADKVVEARRAMDSLLSDRARLEARVAELEAELAQRTQPVEG